MATKSTVVDAEGNELEDLGTMTWEEAVELDPQPSGLTNRLPCEEMLTEEGYTHTIVDNRGGRTFKCIYNENYVSHCMLKNILKPLGVITAGGVVKKNLLTTVLMPKFIAYAEAETDRRMESELKIKAQEISAINGKSFEECLNFLKSGSFEEVPEKQKVTA